MSAETDQKAALRRLRAAVAGGVAILALLGGAARVLSLVYGQELATPFRHRQSEWAGSTTCGSCHPDHYASWHRTFHRTMTQEATASSVEGAFDGRIVTFEGVDARPTRRGDAFFIDYLDPSGNVHNSMRVVKTVGSRRYQQYLVGDADDGSGNLLRVPLLWHIGEQRWIHLNGAFLGPDGKPYDQHLTLWNQNCIFCHNTGPSPGSRNFDELEARSRRGEPVDLAFGGSYDSTVAELGIACESCHAPAAEHARRNRDPIRRYVLHLTARDDPTVVNAEKLAARRSVDVCGQCHGQRLPEPLDTVREWLMEGPAYRAGERLQDSVQPIFIDTAPPGPDPDLYRPRFWTDGTPRLTAYEYQGLLLSPCFQEGDLTCVSCHGMHDDDVRGQVRPGMRTNQACAACHRELVERVSEHSKHRSDSSGSNCYECHMPRIVYGILEIHRSHRIENPDPARDAEAGRPNACTSCHSDQSVAWAARIARDWWGDRYRPPGYRGDGAPTGMIATTADLLSGDPVQRAVAARLASRRDTPMSPSQRAFLVPLLLEGLKDNYPTIRWFSRLSLISLAEEIPVAGFDEPLKRFDYLGPEDLRRGTVQRLEEIWGAMPKGDLPGPPADSILSRDYLLWGPDVELLKSLRSTTEVSIGE